MYDTHCGRHDDGCLMCACGCGRCMKANNYEARALRAVQALGQAKKRLASAFKDGGSLIAAYAEHTEASHKVHDVALAGADLTLSNDVPTNVDEQWLVLIFFDGGDVDAARFSSEETARGFYDSASLNWSNVYLTKVLRSRPLETYESEKNFP